MIYVNKTWEETSYDEDGEMLTEEYGFDYLDEPMTFRDLVEELREHRMPSHWPMTGSTFEWVHTEQAMRKEDGVWKATGVHYAQMNPPKNAKYWRWALIHAGLMKGDKK